MSPEALYLTTCHLARKGGGKGLEYWYKYRNDLWKRVTLYEWNSKGVHHPRKQSPEEKLQANIRRASRQIEAYALCNPWQWFGTFTLNPKYRDRTDLDTFRQDFMRMLRDLRRKYGDIEALLVPELHKSGEAWHIHGLIWGLPLEALRPFTLNEKLPKYIRDKLKKGELVYDWPQYRNGFGWVDIESIKNRDAAARYITKYITKSTEDSTAKAIESGKHLYYVTRGLELPERIETENASGAVPEAFPVWLMAGKTYNWDYGEVQWYELPKRHSISSDGFGQEMKGCKVW